MSGLLSVLRMSDLRTLLASCGRVDNVSIAWRPPRDLVSEPATRPDAPPLSSPGGLGGGAYAPLRPPVVPPVISAQDVGRYGGTTTVPVVDGAFSLEVFTYWYSYTNHIRLQVHVLLKTNKQTNKQTTTTKLSMQ